MGEPRHERVARRLEIPMLVAAVLVIPAIAIEQSSLSGTWDDLALALNWLIWSAFAGELVLMLVLVPRRGEWLRRHLLEVAIVVLTPPFLPAALQSLRVVRLLRLLRLVRLVVLLRRVISPGGVRFAALLAAVTILGGGSAFAALESTSEKPLSAWDGVWWAITTVTTVGYGDFFPTTVGGRLVAMVVMLVGIGFVALVTAALAERFLAGRVNEAVEQLGEEEEALLAELSELSQRIARIEQSLRVRRTTGAARAEPGAGGSDP